MYRTGKTAMVVTALCGLLLLGATTGRAQTVFVEGQSNEFGLLDVATGDFTPIGTTQRTIFGMGFAPDGTLYGLTSGLNARLQTINPADASTTTIGRIGQVASTAVMRNGTFYVMTNDFASVFYSLTPPSLTTSPINSGLPFSEDGLVAFDAQGNLFAGAVGPGNDILYKIDPSTGAAVQLGDTGFFGIEAGTFLNGTLYGFDSAGDILTLDPISGAGTLVGTYNLPDADAIVAIANTKTASVPEPGTLPLLASLTLCGAGFLARCCKWARPPKCRD